MTPSPETVNGQRGGTKRLALLAAVTLLSAAACAGSTASSGAIATTRPAVAVPTTATAGQALRTISAGTSVWVNAAVATLWTSPQAPRPVDAKATSATVDIRGWLAAMSTSARLGLVGRVETQALYGNRLLVTGVRPGWLHVVAPGQPTRRDSRGYPGWVPTRQVTTRAPAVTARVATVTSITAWLRSSSGSRVMEVSFGTRLPVLGSTPTAVTVATPTRSRLTLRPTDVVVRPATAGALPRTAAAVMASARRFLGRPYIWGGRSGFAVDCSGLTSLVYAVHGVVIPRDTDDQARAGSAVPAGAWRLADLALFRSGAQVTHVGFYAGAGQMLHAPRTGTVVQISPVGRPALVRRVMR